MKTPVKYNNTTGKLIQEKVAHNSTEMTSIGDYSHADIDEHIDDLGLHGATGQVLVSNNDTEAGYLNDKIIVSGAISKEITEPSGNEKLQLTVTETNKAKVSANDTNADYLESKIVAGDNVTISVNNDGGNETIEISADVLTTDDEMVKVSATDTDSKYLDDKIAVSGAITKTILNPGANEVIELEVEDASLQYFDEARNTTAPNATVPAHQLVVVGAESNIDLVLSPKGTGAIIAQIPDGTAAGGNKRGVNSVDLQMSRVDNSYISSGQNSVICGGYTNKASGTASVVVGGGNNVATNSYASILGGYGHTASGDYSVVCGGNANYTQAQGASVLGGVDNRATINLATIIGGSENRANSNSSAIVGGVNGVTSHYAQVVNASGQLNYVSGSAQGTIQIVWKDTYNNNTGSSVEREAYLGGTGRFTLSNYQVVTMVFTVVARRVGSTTIKAGGVFIGTFARDNGADTTALIGSITQLHWVDSSSSLTPPDFSADTTNGSIKVTVSYPNDTNLHWVIIGRSAETITAS